MLTKNQILYPILNLRKIKTAKVLDSPEQSPRTSNRSLLALLHHQKQLEVVMKNWSYLLLCLILVAPARAQYTDQGLGAGIGFGQAFGWTETPDQRAKFMVRAFVRSGLTKNTQWEIGAGLGRVQGLDYLTQVVPIDLRLLLSPFSFTDWNPYIFAGIGALHVDSEELPPNATPGIMEEGWTGVAPGGMGLQFHMSENVSFEAVGAVHYTFYDDLNGVNNTFATDAFITWQAGLTVVGESGEADPDGDGLKNKEEKELGTDKKNPDSDADGLTDGAEVKQHNTNALKADSDGDTLNDGDEVKTHMTDPNKADTDGDGLADGDEVKTHKTNATNADSDADGLNDGAEVNVNKTNPTNPDTDADGLNDGAEVTTNRTNPLNADTDGGTVNDGIEVGRGTNPLLADDDIKKEGLKVEVGTAVILEGLTFETGKAVILPESDAILEKAYNTFEQNPDGVLEVHGHTDNTGKRSTNMKLSQARADAVKTWLVKRGVAEHRIIAKGFGPDKPIAPNDTKEGRAKNRRTDFYRAK